jgi:hypothetical protein
LSLLFSSLSLSLFLIEQIFPPLDKEYTLISTLLPILISLHIHFVQFKKISHAYEILSDTSKRAIYDEYGEEGLSNPIPPAPQDPTFFVYWVAVGLWTLTTIIDWYFSIRIEW